MKQHSYVTSLIVYIYDPPQLQAMLKTIITKAQELADNGYRDKKKWLLNNNIKNEKQT